MLFNSFDFLIFFPIVALIYFLVPGKIKNLWLLLSSYYFYMCWNVKYTLLIFMSTAVTYLSGLLMEKVSASAADASQKRLRRKCIVFCSLLFNLGILFFFKYADYVNFFTQLLNRLLTAAHIAVRFPSFHYLLPVGISFYTFQALGYTLDVYREKIPAEKNFIRYALFVSFFPQLVAGPIERSDRLLTQFYAPRKFDFERARDGLFLIVWGFFLKIVLADRIAVFVDTVYGDYATYPGCFLIVATVLFAVQIYCDFNGYSMIAVGTAEILGFSLMDNFNAPYFAVSIAEFWRRWHISLTSWFKDYLYIPLGGNRRGKLRKYGNQLFTFLVSGLWHGASPTFCIWGGLNGIYQIFGEVLLPVRTAALKLFHLHENSFGHKLARLFLTFCMVDFSWIFFRADSCRSAFAIICSMLSVHNPWILFDGSVYQCGLDDKNFRLMLLCIILLIFADFCKYRKISVRSFVLRQDYWFRCLFISLSMIGVLIFGKWGPNFNAANFIYFQF